MRVDLIKHLWSESSFIFTSCSTQRDCRMWCTGTVHPWFVCTGNFSESKLWWRRTTHKISTAPFRIKRTSASVKEVARAGISHGQYLLVPCAIYCWHTFSFITVILILDETKLPFAGMPYPFHLVLCVIVCSVDNQIFILSKWSACLDGALVLVAAN